MSSKSNIKNFDRDDTQSVIYQNAKNGQYQSIENEDHCFNKIKELCIDYVDSGAELEHAELEAIDAALNFLNEKTIDIIKLKESLELSDYSWQLTEIKQTTDEYILSGGLNNICNEIIGGKLSKDITITLELIKFCYVILKDMKKSILENENDYRD
jgi:hypothetical protein